MITIEQQERLAADHCIQVATAHATINAPDDIEAAAVAILVQALEMATPDLSPELRASLFLHQEN